MVTSLSRAIVEHGGVLNPRKSGRRTGLDLSQPYTETVRLPLAPTEPQSRPHHVVICIQQQPPALALGGWGGRGELRKKEGAVVLDKETIDVSAFSPSLN